MKATIVSFSEISKMAMNMSPSLYANKAYEEFKHLSTEELFVKTQDLLVSTPSYMKNEIITFLKSVKRNEETDHTGYKINPGRALSSSSLGKVTASIEERKNLPETGFDKNAIYLVICGLLTSWDSIDTHTKKALAEKKELLQRLLELDEFINLSEKES